MNCSLVLQIQIRTRPLIRMRIHLLAFYKNQISFQKQENIEGGVTLLKRCIDDMLYLSVNLILYLIKAELVMNDLMDSLMKVHFQKFYYLVDF